MPFKEVVVVHCPNCQSRQNATRTTTNARETATEVNKLVTVVCNNCNRMITQYVESRPKRSGT